MKKQIITALIAAALFSVSVTYTFTGFADNTYDDIKVIYDGTELEFEVPPQIINDSTMVPMRAVFEKFGASVKWDGDTQTITAKRKSKTITMTIGSSQAYKNDEAFEMSASPVIISGTTLVPLRAVSELLGLDVSWDEDSRTVTITTPDDSSDDTWKENTGTINLDTMSVDGDGVSVDGNTITISKGGDFTVTGTLADGQIAVNALDENGDKDKVKLRLSGASITNSSGPAISVTAADELFITLTDGTENSLTDSETYSDESIDGCIYSKDDIEIKGSGSLNINANHGHGIKSNDSLEIGNGTININAENDGLHANETILISGGTLNIDAVGDGIQAEEILNITGGDINVKTTGYVEPSNTNTMRGMRFEPSPSPAASDNAAEIEDTADTASSKGIKADWMMTISGGNINIDSTDHSVHCADEINFNGGTVTVSSSSGKGISGHGAVNLNGTDITVTNATEGIESKSILTINDGNIDITCSDDGLNAGGTNGMDTGMGGGMGRPSGDMAPPDNSDMSAPSDTDTAAPPDRNNSGMDSMTPPNRNGGANRQNEAMTPPDNSDTSAPSDTDTAAPPDRNGGMGGGMNPSGMVNPQDSSEQAADSEHHIQINGGNISINAQGDGIDSNGTIIMDGGYVVVNGPTSGGDSSIDYGSACWINGGTLISIGSGRMLENPSSYSEQYVISAFTSAEQAAGTPITIKDSSGNIIMCISPLKSYSHIYFSSDKLTEGETYTLYEGGECSGVIDEKTGVYSGGSISGGSEAGSVSLNADTHLASIGSQSLTANPGGGMSGKGMGGGRRNQPSVTPSAAPTE